MDIFGPVDSIYADAAAEHPTQLTGAHLGVTAKMHHARALGSKLHEASLRERRQTKSTEPFRPGGLVGYAPDVSQRRHDSVQFDRRRPRTK
jgi:hypothetical protein